MAISQRATWRERERERGREKEREREREKENLLQRKQRTNEAGLFGSCCFTCLGLPCLSEGVRGRQRCASVRSLASSSLIRALFSSFFLFFFHSSNSTPHFQVGKGVG